MPGLLSLRTEVSRWRNFSSGLSETEFVAWITYGGIKHAALAGYTNNKPPENIHYIYELMDDLTGEQMGLIGKTFAESKVIGRTMKELIDAAAGNDKKKRKHQL